MTLLSPLSGLIIGEYTLLQAIGVGSFATVYRGIHRLSQLIVAVKCIQKGPNSKQAAKEVCLLRTLTHNNVVKLYACVETVEMLFLVMEYCDMDLYEAITTTPIHHEIAKEIFKQILDAVSYCHAQGVYHRDLKPENILISTQSDDYTICLADFGLATKDTASFDLGCGSSRYMAPESINSPLNTHYTPSKCDVWSLGILLLNLISGSNPWHSAVQSDPVFLAYTTTHPSLLQDAFGLSDALHALIRKCLDPNPITRIPLEALKQAFNAIECMTRPNVKKGGVDHSRTNTLPMPMHEVNEVTRLFAPCGDDTVDMNISIQSTLVYTTDTEDEGEGEDRCCVFPLTPQLGFEDAGRLFDGIKC